jgi:hypothetical protein
MTYIAPVFLKSVIVTLLISLQKTPQKSNPAPRFCAKGSFSGLILTLAKPVFAAPKNVQSGAIFSLRRGECARKVVS